VLNILSTSAGETLGAKLSVFIKNFPIASNGGLGVASLVQMLVFLLTSTLRAGNIR